ncbi:MAG: hypothetical protein M3Y72_02520 [Acidobacteriota bacterium]|nr:hypothetical protein [Acidobacteriota bacterium]
MWREVTKSILALLVAFACVQPASPRQTDSPTAQFTGTWKGNMNDQPAVNIVLTPDGRKLGGTIIFYFQRLGSDGKWHVEGDNRPQPLIGPQVDGNVVSFEVLHHKQHGGSELGPNKKYRLEFTAENEARFREAGGPSDIQGQGLKLTREVNR